MPAALWGNGGGGVIEVFILGFKEAVVDFVELVTEDLLWGLFATGDGIGAKEDAVLVLVEEAAGGAGLAAEFADASGDVDGKVGVLVEGGGDVLEVFGEVADVEGDELRFGVASEDAIAGGKEFVIGGEAGAVEGPVGVVVEFFKAFVEAVGGEEEGDGVGDVDGDGEGEAAAGVPEGVEAFVVDSEELAGGGVVAEVEAEGFEDFEAAGAVALGLLEEVDLALGVIGGVGFGPGGFGHGEEAAGVGAVELVDGLLEARAVAAGEVDEGADLLAIHDREEIVGGANKLTVAGEGDTVLGAGGPGEVGVEVEDREGGAAEGSLRDAEHGFGLEVFEGEFLLGEGGGGGGEEEAARHGEWFR